MTRYSIEPRTRKYVKFLSFARYISDKFDKILLDTATETGLDAAKLLPEK